MTGDEGDFWNDITKARKARNRVSRLAFNEEGWQRLDDNHFRKSVVGGGRFDYWPSTGTVMWRTKYYRGIRPDVIEGFIRNRCGT